MSKESPPRQKSVILSEASWPHRDAPSKDLHLRQDDHSTPSLSRTMQPNVQLWHHHHLKLRTTVGALALSIDLDLTSNWTVIFGPSGSGKSTILRAIAGLLPNTEADLVRHDRDRIEHDLTHLPPRDRRIAYAPQQPSLFPHLTVADNVAFAQSSEQHITAAIKLFRLADLIHRYPRNLSGGERQRVNLARAFAMPNSQLMLLDEPFAGIDRPLRDAILPELRESLRLAGIPVVSVTHDVEEAFLLQPEVVVLRDGRIHEQGYVSKVLSQERLSILNALR